MPKLTSWGEGPHIIDLLDRLGWKPADADEVHALVARRIGSELRRHEATNMVLLDDLASDDRTQIENAVWAMVGLGDDHRLDAMVGALDNSDSTDLAESFLNCGHGRLGEAARRWAQHRGYEIKAGRGNKPIGWGALRD